jgi:hypothetical protein
LGGVALTGGELARAFLDAEAADAADCVVSLASGNGASAGLALRVAVVDDLAVGGS